MASEDHLQPDSGRIPESGEQMQGQGPGSRPECGQQRVCQCLDGGPGNQGSGSSAGQPGARAQALLPPVCLNVLVKWLPWLGKGAVSWGLGSSWQAKLCSGFRGRREKMVRGKPLIFKAEIANGAAQPPAAQGQAQPALQPWVGSCTLASFSRPRPVPFLLRMMSAVKWSPPAGG